MFSELNLKSIFNLTLKLLYLYYKNNIIKMNTNV